MLFWSIQTAIIDYQKLVVMTLFLHTFEPYVHMAELWIHGAQLVDENNEFIITSYEGDSSTLFNVYFRDIYEYLDVCNLNVPPILEYLKHFLNNCDWKVFVASQISNTVFTLCEVPRGLQIYLYYLFCKLHLKCFIGELFHNFLMEIKNSNSYWNNYINLINQYCPSNWNQSPLLASSCVIYK